VLRNKMMVALMHPLLRNLREILVENVLVLSAIHHSSRNIFFRPISLDSEDSCCSTARSSFTTSASTRVLALVVKELLAKV